MDVLNDFEAVLLWLAIVWGCIYAWKGCQWAASQIGLGEDLVGEPSPASSRMAATTVRTIVGRELPARLDTDLCESSDPPVGFTPHRALRDTGSSRVVATTRTGEYGGSTGLRVVPRAR